MAGDISKYDPWGPISTLLFGLANSDLVLDAIGNTGIAVGWRPLTENEAYSHGTRIRAYRRDVMGAYAALDDDMKGPFSQNIIFTLLQRHDSDKLLENLRSSLERIGWTVSDEGRLETLESLLGEQFFPPNSEFDAYQSVRQILTIAKTEVVVVDGYIGESLLITLSAIGRDELQVRVLTSNYLNKGDFRNQLAAFTKQHQKISVEIRISNEFHDRFIVIDQAQYFHIGASIKDAGKRAFMISQIEDKSNVAALSKSIEDSWGTAATWP